MRSRTLKFQDIIGAFAGAFVAISFKERYNRTVTWLTAKNSELTHQNTEPQRQENEIGDEPAQEPTSRQAPHAGPHSKHTRARMHACKSRWWERPGMRQPTPRVGGAKGEACMPTHTVHMHKRVHA